jgi:hypothetical protein
MAAMVGGVVTFLLMRTNGEWMELSDWKAAAVHMVLSSLLFVLFYLGAVVAMHRGYSRPYNDIRLMLEMLPFGRVMRHSPESALPAPTGLVAKIGEASEAV